MEHVRDRPLHPCLGLLEHVPAISPRMPPPSSARTRYHSSVISPSSLDTNTCDPDGRAPVKSTNAAGLATAARAGEGVAHDSAPCGSCDPRDYLQHIRVTRCPARSTPVGFCPRRGRSRRVADPGTHRFVVVLDPFWRRDWPAGVRRRLAAWAAGRGARSARRVVSRGIGPRPRRAVCRAGHAELDDDLQSRDGSAFRVEADRLRTGSPSEKVVSVSTNAGSSCLSTCMLTTPCTWSRRRPRITG